MQDQKKLPHHIIRWITPSRELLQKIVDARNQQKIASGTPPTSAGEIITSLNFVGIVRDECVPVAIRMDIQKQFHQVLKNGVRQQPLTGLNIPDDAFQSQPKIVVCIYFLTESLANSMKIRQRARCKKQKTSLQNNSNPDQQNNWNACHKNKNSRVNIVAPPKSNIIEIIEPMETNATVEPLAVSVNTTTWISGGIKIQPNWVPYNKCFSLDTKKLKYNKCSWFSFPKDHPITLISNDLSFADGKSRLLASMLSLPITENQYLIPARDLIECCQSEFIDKILEKIVRFHRKKKNLHVIVTSCLKKWVRREKKKLARKNNKGVDHSLNMSLFNVSLTCVNGVENLTGDSSPNLASSPSHNSVVIGHGTNYNKQKSIGFSKLNGKISYKCIISTVSQILYESGFNVFLGSRSNVRKFLKFFRQAVLLGGLKSNLSLELLMSRLSPEGCEWLDGVKHPKLKVHLLAKIASWLFLEYVLVMLRSSFYITESSSSRYQLEFYLRNAWKSVTESLHNRLLKTGKMVQIPQQSQVTTQTNAIIRYIPKKNNHLRPIVSYSKEVKQQIKTDSGQLLVKYMSSTISPHGVIDAVRLQNYWQRFLRVWKAKGCPKLYFFRSDIKDAYPSVCLPKLKRILDTFPLPNALQECQYIRWRANRKIARKVTFLRPRNLEDPLYIQDRPWFKYKKMPNKISINIKSTLESVKSTLKDVVVKVGKHKYAMDLGLPQGWQLSQHLCNIYYGTMDSKHLSEFLGKGDEFFIRNVDDYFFIAMDPLRVAALQQKMRNGFKDFNCAMNSDKSWSNLYVRSDESLDRTNNSQIKFCGWKFCLDTGHVTRDFDSYIGLDTCSTLTFAMRQESRPATFISKRIVNLTPLRFNSFLFNSNFNCWGNVLRNVFNGALMMTFRFYAMCRVVYPNLRLLSEDKEEMKKLASALVHGARLIVNSVQKLQTQSVHEPTALYTCGAPISLSSCVASSENLVNQKPAGITEHEFFFVIYHAVIIKLLQHKDIFKTTLLPQLLRRKRFYAKKIGDEKAKNITSVAGRGLPSVFGLMKK